MDPKPTVVALSDYRQAPMPAALQQVERYWSELRGDRLMPWRSEIDPRRLSDVLEHAFVLERIARGLARFRVAGTSVSAVTGTEMRGMPLTTMFMPDSRELVGETLEALFDEPIAATFVLGAPGRFGRPATSAQMMLLPLRGDTGNVDRALGCLVADASGGRTPCRFNVTDTQRRSLTGYATPPQAAQPDPAPTPPAPRSHLQLVKSDA